MTEEMGGLGEEWLKTEKHQKRENIFKKESKHDYKKAQRPEDQKGEKGWI